MKALLSKVVILSALALTYPLSSLAFMASEQPALPNFDKRAAKAPGRKVVSVEKQAAAKQLRALLPRVRVDFDPVTGAPQRVAATDSFLTGANGVGKTVSAAAASGIAPYDSYGATRAFLKAHSQLFGQGPEALDQARIKRDYVTPHNGLRTIVWEQQVDGLPVFEGVLISHTTYRGELVSICSQFLPDPADAASRGRSAGAASVTAPSVSARRAVALGAQNAGENLLEEKIGVSGAASAGTEQRQKFTAPGLNGEADAKLVWLPMDKQTLRLCWDVVLTSRSRGEMFRTLVDARTGEVLLRRCLTSYLTDASYRVFASDSPSPFSPGDSTPAGTQPPLVDRALVTFSALNTNASPAGWINDGDNQTLGNNVDAHTDWNANDLPDLPRPQGSPFRVFDFPMDLATQDPTNYASATAVQLFYLCNWYHDRLYQLGFTEAAGNFQTDNFGRGGLGGDAVQADAQDGSGVNNANFSTPPDGSVGRMQMYIFTGPSPRRDGDLDAEVVLHEATHGLSWRLVGGGQALGDTQSDGMGEGWSDFYALSLLSEAGDDVNGNYACGAYVSYRLGGAGDTQNYYFGIRRYPYTTDMSRNPLTFKDIDPAQADYCSSGAPYHTGMFGSCSATTANEVHNAGEVWCIALWEARASLINKHGWAVGNQLSLQLVTDGMKLTPPHPNFLQARDAILQADLVDTGGANQNELWAAFAKRGMGFGSTSPASSTATGVHESFDLPDDLRIAPQDGFVANGPVGGPFTPNTMTLALTNMGSNSLTWAAANTNPWLSVLPTSGALTPGGPAGPVAASLTESANSLPMGVYPGTVWFTNLDSLVGQGRQFTLRVGQPDYFTELFYGSITNLSFQSFSFTPDGSSSFYAACRQPVAAFFTDPTGGTPVSLADDNYAMATITGGSTVAIYGTRGGVFYIGSNGYLTMSSGDSYMVESFPTHFNLPRVSALFHDLNPESGGSVSWKQLADRVAVTFQAVPVYGTSTQTNSFQIEMFFDGRIRITYLEIKAPGALAGLSAGTGEPANFMASDFSSYGACSPMSVVLPGSAPENAGVLAGAGSVWLGSALPTNLTVALASSDPTRLTVPPSISILAGQPNGAFNLTLVDNSVHDGDQIVTVTASSESFTNVSASMLVVDDDTPPRIIVQPASRTVTISKAATFSITATGQAPLHYFWSRNGNLIDAATDSSYTTNDLQMADSGSLFSCLVTNAFGTALSSNALLTVVTGVVDLITFDDLAGSSLSLPAGYHGLDWGSFYYLNVVEYPNASGYSAGMISVSNVVYNSYGTNATIRQASPFSLLSAYLTAAWQDNLQLQVLGYDGGTLLYSNTYVLSATSPTLVEFNYNGVNQVEFISSGGTPHPGYPNIGTHFAMDNLVILATPSPPLIIAQPANLTVPVGGSASFCVTASGSPPLSYYWYRNGAPIPGATTSCYATNNMQLSDSGAQFSCLVSNAYGTTNSLSAALTVILGPPNDLCSDAIAISTPTYTNTQSTADATTIGDPSPSCGYAVGKGVWYQFVAPANGVLAVDTYGSSFDTVLALYSGTCDSLTQLACNDDNGGTYQSSITSAASAGTTYYLLVGGYTAVSGELVFHLSFATPPGIVTEPQPSTLTLPVGSAATFTMTASGTEPLGYQWRKGGAPISDSGTILGATTPSLTVSNIVPDDSAQYSVLITNAYGSAVSSNATLLVTIPAIQMGRSANLLLIYWPAAFQGFVLETATNLPSTNWLPEANPPLRIGDQMIVPLIISEQQRFFRLRWPAP